MGGKIIAESGGSKTSWCVVNEGDKPFFVEAESLRPEYWGELKKRIPSTILSLNLSKYDLCFFGAGCFQQEKQEILRELFQELGFRSICVFGDVDAAALSALNKQNGFVAILGSGSVLCKVQNGKVHTIIGGKGVEDDFGSGYRFGRMVQKCLFDGELDIIDSTIKEKVKAAQSKEEYLALSSVLKDENVAKIHAENIRIFLEELVLPTLQKPETLHFVGSYAYFHQKIIRSELEKVKVKPGKFIAKPIDELIHIL